MIRCRFSITLLVAAGLMLPDVTFCQSNATKREIEVKREALDIRDGGTVQVDFLHERSLYGRLSQVTDQGFNLQYLDHGTIRDRTIAYSEVKLLYRSDVGRVLSHRTIAIAVTAGLIGTAAIAVIVLSHHRPPPLH
jgi:hypothetical protein